MNIIKKVLIIPALSLFCLATISVGTVQAIPSDYQSFKEFIDSFYKEAARNGITRSTYNKAFAGVSEPYAEVLQKAKYQPEFTTKIWDYLDSRVNQVTINNGRMIAEEYGNVLMQIESQFGVDAPFLIAIWSMESSYGKALQSSKLYYVPRALATLAYADRKRQKFSRSQLIATMKIIQAGDVAPDQLYGSWAGAMGHTQFIPTSFIAYAVDMDGDGRRDIWHSVPDALATAANLLHKNGWRTGRPWGYEVVVPRNGKQFQNETRTLEQWARLGFKHPAGIPFDNLQEKAVLKLIGGDNGPGFLMLKNFFVLKKYNNSDFYALAVGLLADRIAGKSGMIQSWPRPLGSLSINGKFELQELLKEKGFYQGEIDGSLGPMSREAVRKFQQSQNMVVDGNPTLEVLNLLRKQ